ncbi:hypothetical protein [Nitrosospira lacus]|uniref:hypothetical protein n=1 Tax=Nitrosospira lacus TaxID=1288494 RepID=UPI0003A59559|nr:hypothetical protein [Nitrosospira lacus]
METDTWPIIVGMVFGGLFAAPLAAVLRKKLHARTLLVLVGTLIIITKSLQSLPGDRHLMGNSTEKGLKE